MFEDLAERSRELINGKVNVNKAIVTKNYIQMGGEQYLISRAIKVSDVMYTDSFCVFTEDHKRKYCYYPNFFIRFQEDMYTNFYETPLIVDEPNLDLYKDTPEYKEGLKRIQAYKDKVLKTLFE